MGITLIARLAFRLEKRKIVENQLSGVKGSDLNLSVSGQPTEGLEFNTTDNKVNSNFPLFLMKICAIFAIITKYTTDFSIVNLIVYYITEKYVTY